MWSSRPTVSGLTLRGAPVTESHQMLYMDHGGASNSIFKQGFRYVVQTIGPATSYHQGTLDMIKKLDPNAKNVALAYEDDEFAKMVMEGAKEHAVKLGFNVVFERTYPKGVTDMTPLLSALKAVKTGLHSGWRATLRTASCSTGRWPTWTSTAMPSR